MIDEWIKFITLLDQRNSLSSSIHSALKAKNASSKKRELE